MINILALTLALFNIFYPVSPNSSTFFKLELQDGKSIVKINSDKQIDNTYTNAKMTCEFIDQDGKLLYRQKDVYSCAVNVKLELPSFLFVRVINKEKVKVKYSIEVNSK
jgi:hypothetical protein